MKKKIYALAVIFLLLLLTAGCTDNVHLTENGSGPSGESKKPEPPISIPPDAELIEVTPTPQAEDAGRLVYLILPTETGLSLREKEIITETLGASNINVEVRTHGYETETQSQLFLEAFEAGADLILCDNADQEMTAEDVAAAYEAEIPVILMNRGTMSIGSAAGQLVTDRFSCMGKLIEVFAKREEGFSRYALLCDRSNMEDSDSADSFRDMMFTYPDMVCQVEEDVSGQDEEQLKETVRQILAANPYIHAFVCANADETQAVCDVLAEEQISRTVICLNGNEDRVYELCRSGSVFATIVKPADAIAEKACEEVLHYFEHGSTGENEFRYFAGVIVTMDDIAAEGQAGTEGTEESEIPDESQPEPSGTPEPESAAESTESGGTESTPSEAPGESKGEMADFDVSPETTASPVTEAGAESTESH